MDFDPLMSEPQDEGEGWLVSYADMMTLIACFFILMMAFANYDPVGFNDKAEKISKSFRTDKFKSSLFKLKYIQEEMTKYDEVETKNKISVNDGALISVFSSSVLFEDNRSDLKKEALANLDSMIDIIKDNSPTARVLIEGHSDELSESDEDPLSISAKRAVYVANRFKIHGFPKGNLSVLAKGDGDLLKKSLTSKGVKKPEVAAVNRRVVIRVLEPVNKKKVKMGLGVYFKDSTDHTKENYSEQISEEFQISTEEK